jgi:hypothetical protein
MYNQQLHEQEHLQLLDVLQQRQHLFLLTFLKLNYLLLLQLQQLVLLQALI